MNRVIFLSFIALLFYSCNKNQKVKYTIVPEGQVIDVSSKNKSINGIKLVIPKNAISNTISISISECKTPPFQSELLQTISPTINFLNNTGKHNINFHRDVLVTIPISKIERGFPFIGYFNEKINDWEFFKAEEITDSTITFKTNHFSIYTTAVFSVQNIYRLINEIKSDKVFYNALLAVVKGSDNLESQLQIFKQISTKELEHLLTLDKSYNDCKEKLTCDLIYKDFISFLHSQFISQATQTILVNTILTSTAEASIVSTAFTIGSVITDIMLIDCIACFIPNSVMSYNFWQSFIKYHLAEYYIIYIENQLLSKQILEYKDWRGNILKTITFYKNSDYVNRKIEKYKLEFTEPFYSYIIDDEHEQVVEKGVETTNIYDIGKVFTQNDKQHLQKFTSPHGEIIYFIESLGYFVLINEPSGDGMSDKIYEYKALLFDSDGKGRLSGIGYKQYY